MLTDVLLREYKSQQQLAKAREQLRQYALKAEDRATVHERNRIAREIHDSVGHVLTAQAIQLSNAIAFWQSDPPKAHQFLIESRESVRTALKDIRHSVSTLRSDPLQGKKLEKAKELTLHYPEIKVLILTTFDDDEYISQAMNYGAKGYLLKDTLPEDLAMAIYAVNKGHTYLGAGLFEKISQRCSPTAPPSADLARRLAELSPREQEVLNLIAQGANNREIATKLYISHKTVKNHVTSILSKLNLRDRTQAALLVSKI